MSTRHLQNVNTLGASAPYSHQATSMPIANSLDRQALSNHPLAKWIPFFGEPVGGITPQSAGLATSRDIFNLPEAYRGKPNKRIETILINNIAESKKYPITALLPLTEWDGSHEIVWDVWKFHDARLGRVPEQAVSRLLSSSFSEDRAYMVRWGIMFMLEHDFMNTDRGKINYAKNLQQISNACIETLCHGAMIAMFACQPISFDPAQMRTHVTDKADRDNLFGEEHFMTGVMVKQKMGLSWVWDQLRTRINDLSRLEPTALVIPFGMTKMINMTRPENIFQFYMGKDYNPERKPDTGFGGKVAMYESQPWRIAENEKSEDVAYQQRVYGFYHTFDDRHLSNVDPVQFRTNMMDRQIFNERENDWVVSSYKENVAKSGLFFRLHSNAVGRPPSDKDGGGGGKNSKKAPAWTNSQLGSRFFSGYSNCGDLLRGVGSYERWVTQLKKDKDRRAAFFKCFGQPAANTEKVTTEKIKAAIQKVVDLAGNAQQTAKGSGGSAPADLGSGSLLDLAKKALKSKELEKQLLATYTIGALQVGPLTPAVEQRLRTGLEAKSTPIVDDVFIAKLVADASTGQGSTDVYTSVANGGKATTVRVGGVAPKGVLRVSKDLLPNLTEAVLFALGKKDAEVPAAISEVYGAVAQTQLSQRIKRADIHPLQWHIQVQLAQAAADSVVDTAGVAGGSGEQKADVAVNSAFIQRMTGWFNGRNLPTFLANYRVGDPSEDFTFGTARLANQDQLAGLRSSTDEVDRKKATAFEAALERVKRDPDIDRLLRQLDVLYGENADLMRDLYASMVLAPSRGQKLTPRQFFVVMAVIESMLKDQTRKAGDDDVKTQEVLDKLRVLLQELSVGILLGLRDAIATDTKYSVLWEKGKSKKQVIADANRAEVGLAQTLTGFQEALYEISKTASGSVFFELEEALKAHAPRLASAIDKHGNFSQFVKRADQSEVERLLETRKSLGKGDAAKGEAKADDLDALLPFIEPTLFALPISRAAELVYFGLEYDMWPILAIRAHRPYATWIMGSAVALIQGGTTGSTFKNGADFMLGDNPSRKMHMGHFTMYAKSVITRKDTIAVAPDIYPRGYVAGYNSEIWDLADPEHRRDYLDGNVRKRDIFPFPVPINEPAPEPYYDMTGKFHRALATSQDQPAYTFAEQMTHAWRMQQATINPLSRNYLNYPGVAMSNTLVFRCHHKAYTQDGAGNVVWKDIWGAGARGRYEYAGKAHVWAGKSMWEEPLRGETAVMALTT